MYRGMSNEYFEGCGEIFFVIEYLRCKNVCVIFIDHEAYGEVFPIILN
jgi:hypothetical protein